MKSAITNKRNVVLVGSDVLQLEQEARKAGEMQDSEDEESVVY